MLSWTEDFGKLSDKRLEVRLRVFLGDIESHTGNPRRVVSYSSYSDSTQRKNPQFKSETWSWKKKKRSKRNGRLDSLEDRMTLIFFIIDKTSLFQTQR